ncbi:MAG: hypothetical protein N3A38_11730 [Planctomycetota bacterium]|nr:hypothetical protein [Planctomycetota bacterium]
MAYTAEDRMHIAKEVARAGGNISAAVRELRENYETFARIKDETIRRFMREPAFQAEVGRQAKLLAEAEAQATVEAERERLRLAMREGFERRIEALEAQCWKVLDRILDELERRPDDLRAQFQFWQKAFDFVREHRRNAGAVVGEIWQAEALVRAYRRALAARVGPALAEQIHRDVAKAYEAELRARAENDAARAAADAAAGTGTREAPDAGAKE